MDVIYTLGENPLANYKKIMYSIRSIQKNMLDLRNIYIVGGDPQNLPSCIHIPSKDFSDTKWKDIHSKLLLACKIEDLSDEFLFVEENFILNEPFFGAQFPYYAKKGGSGGNSGTHDFNIECPIKYSKEFYLQLPIPSDMKGQFCPRSFYSNFFRVPFEFGKTCNLSKNEKDLPFHELTKSQQFFSFSDGNFKDTEFATWLNFLLCDKSKFEV